MVLNFRNRSKKANVQQIHPESHTIGEIYWCRLSVVSICSYSVSVWSICRLEIVSDTGCSAANTDWWYHWDESASRSKRLVSRCWNWNRTVLELIYPQYSGLQLLLLQQYMVVVTFCLYVCGPVHQFITFLRLHIQSSWCSNVSDWMNNITYRSYSRQFGEGSEDTTLPNTKYKARNIYLKEGSIKKLLFDPTTISRRKILVKCPISKQKQNHSGSAKRSLRALGSQLSTRHLLSVKVVAGNLSHSTGVVLVYGVNI